MTASGWCSRFGNVSVSAGEAVVSVFIQKVDPFSGSVSFRALGTAAGYVAAGARAQTESISPALDGNKCSIIQFPFGALRRASMNEIPDAEHQGGEDPKDDHDRP